MFFVGISLKKDRFKLAVLKKEKQKIIVADQQSYLSTSENVKLFYNSPFLQSGNKSRIVSGLAASDIFLRKIHLPLKEKRKIMAALPFQLEMLIPFSSENTIVCPLLKPISRKITAVTILATTREQLTSHFATLKNIHIQPDWVSCEPVALARFSDWSFPQQRRILCFFADQDRILCVLCEGPEVLLSQSLPLKNKEEMILELDRLFVFLKQKAVADEQTAWVMTGNLEWTSMISQIFTGPQLQLTDHALAEYAIPIGLALDALKNDLHSVQFCQKEFIPSHIHRLRKNKFFAYLSTCLIATVILLASETFLLGKKQRALSEQLQNVLPASLSQKSLDTLKDIQETLNSWEKSLNRKSASFPFVPNLPKVSDVLAWLSTHPSFSTENGGKKEGIEIKSFHYHLLKHPKIGDPSAPYVGQVEIEFTAVVPRQARDFHESLIQGDEIVNARKEVKWQVQNQTYYTCFELNRTGVP